MVILTFVTGYQFTCYRAQIQINLTTYGQFEIQDLATGNW
jgi:hypothetical protein